MPRTSPALVALAARLLIEEGLTYGAAKLAAAQALGLNARVGLPSNARIESAAEEYIRRFCASTQARELHALRKLALVWMDRLAVFRPLLCGAVWRGIATRRSDILLDLYCEDCKAPALMLLDQGVDYVCAAAPGARGDLMQVLQIYALCPELAQPVCICMTVRDLVDIRARQKLHTRGGCLCGDAPALRQRLSQVSNEF